MEGFTLREISPDDNVSGLSFGDADFAVLKSFLKREAKIHHSENASKTYVFVDSETTKKVIAYITLTCSQIQLGKPPPGLDGYKYPDYPAIKIARLGVNQGHQGLGLGGQLVSLALAVAKTKVMPHVGCRFLIVDSKKKSVSFYDKCGFTQLDTETNRRKNNPLMFIDLGKL